MITTFYSSSCQNDGPPDKKETTLAEVAKEIIRQSGTCTLITVDSIGQPRARIMDPFPPQEDFVVWFGTNSLSRKVEEIRRNNRVTVNYYDKLGGAYVSLYGTAEIIENDSARANYWKAEWQAFYPNYPDGYYLIRFTPAYLELISEKHGITGDPKTWKPATIKF